MWQYDNELLEVHPLAFRSYGKMMRTLGLSGTGQILDNSLRHLQLSKYQLAKLLGVEPSYFYRWVNGSCCPSSVHLGRLLMLWVFHEAGIPVCNMRQILWDASLCLWRDGTVTREDHRPGGPGALSGVDAVEAWRVAEALIVAERIKRGQGRAFDRNVVAGAIPPPQR